MLVEAGLPMGTVTIVFAVAVSAGSPKRYKTNKKEKLLAYTFLLSYGAFATCLLFFFSLFAIFFFFIHVFFRALISFSHICGPPVLFSPAAVD